MHVTVEIMDKPAADSYWKTRMQLAPTPTRGLRSAASRNDGKARGCERGGVSNVQVRNSANLSTAINTHYMLVGSPFAFKISSRSLGLEDARGRITCEFTLSSLQIPWACTTARGVPKAWRCAR